MKAWRRSSHEVALPSGGSLSVVATDLGGEVVQLDWTWPGGDPDHWKIERKHDLDPFGFYINVAGDLRGTFIDEAGFAGLLVTYRVSARDAGDALIVPPGAAVSNSVIVTL